MCLVEASHGIAARGSCREALNPGRLSCREAVIPVRLHICGPRGAAGVHTLCGLCVRPRRCRSTAAILIIETFEFCRPRLDRGRIEDLGIENLRSAEIYVERWICLLEATISREGLCDDLIFMKSDARATFSTALVRWYDSYMDYESPGYKWCSRY